MESSRGVYVAPHGAVAWNDEIEEGLGAKWVGSDHDASFSTHDEGLGMRDRMDRIQFHFAILPKEEHDVKSTMILLFLPDGEGQASAAHVAALPGNPPQRARIVEGHRDRVGHGQRPWLEHGDAEQAAIEDVEAVALEDLNGGRPLELARPFALAADYLLKGQVRSQNHDIVPDGVDYEHPSVRIDGKPGYPCEMQAGIGLGLQGRRPGLLLEGGRGGGGEGGRATATGRVTLLVMIVIDTVGSWMENSCTNCSGLHTRLSSTAVYDAVNGLVYKCRPQSP